jgi:hypothetical protein
MIRIESKNDEMVIIVYKGKFGDLEIRQGDDLIYIHQDNVRLMVAAVRAVATDMLGEEV